MSKCPMVTLYHILNGSPKGSGSRLHPPYQNITKRSQGSIAENGISLEMLCDPLRNALGIPSTGVMLVYFIFPQQTKNTA